MKKSVLLLLSVLLLGLGVSFGADKANAPVTQNKLKHDIRHELVMLPYYSVFDHFAFKTEGSTVTLLGQVVRPSLKNDAANAVKNIDGVEKVVNNIQVLPPSPNDDLIRRAEYRAIYGYPPLNKYSWGAIPPIHIIVNSGHVTLDGVVDSQADRNAAEIQAKSVPGVFSVTNDLRVSNGGESGGM